MLVSDLPRFFHHRDLPDAAMLIRTFTGSVMPRIGSFYTIHRAGKGACSYDYTRHLFYVRDGVTYAYNNAEPGRVISDAFLTLLEQLAANPKKGPVDEVVAGYKAIFGWTPYKRQMRELAESYASGQSAYNPNSGKHYPAGHPVDDRCLQILLNVALGGNGARERYGLEEVRAFMAQQDVAAAA